MGSGRFVTVSSPEGFIDLHLQECESMAGGRSLLRHPSGMAASLDPS